MQASSRLFSPKALFSNPVLDVVGDLRRKEQLASGSNRSTLETDRFRPRHERASGFEVEFHV